FDVSNPASPSFLDQLTDTEVGGENIDNVQEVRVRGKYAYLTASDGDSFAVVDVSDPSNLVYITNVESSTELDVATGLEISGSTAYVAAQNDNALTSIDISDPHNPVILQSVTTGDVGRTTHIAIVGRHAFVTMGGNSASTDGLAVFGLGGIEVSNMHVGSLNARSLSTYGQTDTEDLYVRNSAVIGGGGLVVQGVLSAHNASISGVLDATEIKTQTSMEIAFDIEEEDNPTIDDLDRITAQGDYLYAANSDSDTVVIFDVSNRASPSVSATPDHFPGNGQLEDLEVFGHYLYVADQNNDQIAIFEISNPASPTFTGALDDTNNELDVVRSLAIAGGHMYTVNDRSGDHTLGVWSLSDPENPVLVGQSVQPAGGVLEDPFEVKVVNDTAYVITNTGSDNSTGTIATFDVSNRASPSFLDELTANELSDSDFNLNTEGDIEIRGKYAYVTANSGDALFVFDVSDPSNIAFHSKLVDSTLLNGALGLELVGNVAYVVAVADTSVVAVDITDPANPTIIDTVEDSEILALTEDIVVVGRYAYVTKGNSLPSQDGLVGIKLDGINTTAVDAGSINVHNFWSYGWSNLMDLDVANSANVGTGGLMVQGHLHGFNANFGGTAT
ncbi:MAG: hypothetical protein R3330_09525, partial [Saprospiraceae bacterium]|nr:hypothetical protein [Saprospiraceae bacterium]